MRCRPAAHIKKSEEKKHHHLQIDLNFCFYLFVGFFVHSVVRTVRFCESVWFVSVFYTICHLNTVLFLCIQILNSFLLSQIVRLCVVLECVCMRRYRHFSWKKIER